MKPDFSSLLQRKRSRIQVAGSNASDAGSVTASTTEMKDGYDWLSQLKDFPSKVNSPALLIARG